MKYYDISKRLKNNPHNLQYFFAVSGRGPGKSYSNAKFLKWNFDTNHKKFMRIVRNTRYYSDAGSYFNSFPEYGIDYDGRFYYCNNKEMGRCLALTDYAQIRSGNFDDYNIIFMEEFATVNPDEYLINELDYFLNILSTVVRHRHDCMVIFIGNNNNRMTNYNPYFTQFGIDWDRLNLKQGDFQVIQPISNGARVGIEWVPMAYESIEEIPLILRIPGNELATTGEYEVDPKTIRDLETPRRLLAYNYQFKLDDKFYITIYNYFDKGFIYIKGRKSELSRVHCIDLTLERNEKQIKDFLKFIQKITKVMSEKNALIRYSDEKTHYQFVIAQKNYLGSEKTLN